jgi:hypothetical protein
MIEAEQGGPGGWLQKVSAADKKLGSSGIYSYQKEAGDCPRVRAIRSMSAAECALRNRRRLRAGRRCLAHSSTPEPSVSCKTITSDPPLGRAAQGLGIPSRTVTVEAALSKRSAAADRDSLVVHSPVDMEGCVEPCGTVVSSRRSCPRARSTKPPTSVPVAIVSSPSEKLPVLSLTTPIR